MKRFITLTIICLAALALGHYVLDFEPMTASGQGINGGGIIVSPGKGGGGGAPSGPAGGALTGTYPNPGVDATKLTGVVPLTSGGTGLNLGTNYVVAGETYDNGSGIGTPAAPVALVTGITYFLNIPPNGNDSGILDGSLNPYGPVVGAGFFTVPSSGTYYFVANNPNSPVLQQLYVLNTATLVLPVTNLVVNNLIAGGNNQANIVLSGNYAAQGYDQLFISNGLFSSPYEEAHGYDFNIKTNHNDNFGGDGTEWRWTVNQASMVLPARSHYQFGSASVAFRTNTFYLEASANLNSGSNYTSHLLGFGNEWTNAAHGTLESFWLLGVTNYDAINGNSRLCIFSAPTGTSGSASFTEGPLMLTFDSAGTINSGSNVFKGDGSGLTNFTLPNGIIISNFNIGQRYTNTTGYTVTIMSSWQTPTLSTGTTYELDLRSYNTMTNVWSITTGLTATAQSGNFELCNIVTNNGVWTFTNSRGTFVINGGVIKWP